MSFSEHKATVTWQRKATDDFLSGKFSREHDWMFDGGLTVPASPTPAIIPAPYSNPTSVDPEEAFVASISSCHMLTYLHMASRRGVKITSYQDSAVGTMTKNESGATWMNKVILNPNIVYDGETRPTPEFEAQLHHLAHEKCIIANSVKTEIIVETYPSLPSLSDTSLLP